MLREQEFSFVEVQNVRGLSTAGLALQRQPKSHAPNFPLHQVHFFSPSKHSPRKSLRLRMAQAARNP
ncbi:hypothetical protein TorRG33x02_197450, partial [Trema orientale]